MTKSPLRYPGGKSRAIKYILPKIPLDIKEYREPFIGGGSVFFAVRENHDFDIDLYTISDLNEDLICFWRSVCSETEMLCDIVEGYRTQYQGRGRELYNHFRDKQNFSSPIQKAVRFFILNRITFSGTVDSGGYSQQAFEKRFTESSINRVRNTARSLKCVNILHSDYEQVVTDNGHNVFIFLDPPYHSATNSKLYGDNGNLHTSFDHERFASVMKQCPHRWLITYDDSPYIRELFSFANITEWELQYGMNNYKQKTAEKGKEIFISNY